MLFLKSDKTIWKPSFLRKRHPISTNPHISEQLFHEPRLCPNFKNGNSLPNLKREKTMHLLYINSDYRNLDNSIYATILKNQMQATLNAIIGENQSAAIKNNNFTHIFHHSTCN